MMHGQKNIKLWLRNVVARAIVGHIPLLLLLFSRLSVQTIQFFSFCSKEWKLIRTLQKLEHLHISHFI